MFSPFDRVQVDENAILHNIPFDDAEFINNYCNTMYTVLAVIPKPNTPFGVALNPNDFCYCVRKDYQLKNGLSKEEFNDKIGHAIDLSGLLFLVEGKHVTECVPKPYDDEADDLEEDADNIDEDVYDKPQPDVIATLITILFVLLLLLALVAAFIFGE